jgi:probable rRNA maturation factor
MSSDGSLLFRAIPSRLKLSTEHKRVLQSFVNQLTERVGEGRSFCCLITNDKALHTLNKDFLQHDYPTDVLSFPSLESDNLGEIAISIERAEAQAEQYGHDLLDELRVLMLHGVLHLTGMDHEKDRGEMRRAERKLRTEFGLPSSLIARAAQ